MTTSVLVFSFVNLVLGISVFILWARSSRPQKEDPRLSRGLQLLQSKISVLEDLSDRTDRQVKQLVQILEERAKGLSTKILQAQDMLGRIDQSVAKSLEVADIFQDKIPHDEIIERQNASKYVQAAKLAHEGMSPAEIAQKIGLPISEVEFIAKVNKDELMFEPEALPKWAKTQTRENAGQQMDNEMVQRVFQAKVPDFSGLNTVTANFNQAVDQHRKDEEEVQARQRQAEERRRSFEEKQREILRSAKSVTKSVLGAAEKVIAEVSESTKPMIRKVQFPKIDSDKF